MLRQRLPTILGSNLAQTLCRRCTTFQQVTEGKSSDKVGHQEEGAVKEPPKATTADAGEDSNGAADVRTAGPAIATERSVNAIRRYLRMRKVSRVVRQVRVYASRDICCPVVQEGHHLRRGTWQE
jgi:hypothetical protein